MKLTRDAFCDLRHKAQQALRRSKETPSVLICAGTGCIAGGGQPRVMLPGQPKPRGITDDIRRKRAKGLFDEDLKAANRLSHHNQSIKTLYEEYIGAPNGEKAHQLLHTHYRPRAAYKR